MFNEKNERTVRVSEIFYSIEGEGPLTGFPTVFVRLFGCNFTCQGFSNPTGAEVVLTGTDDLSKFKPTVGCDSIYAWHPKFKPTTKVYTMDELAEAIIAVLPKKFVNSLKSGASPILSFTGGEPTMHQAVMTAILFHPLLQDFDKVLIETNASLSLKPVFLANLNRWVSESGSTLRQVFWACSPKLSNSGESQERAIRPDVIASQSLVDSVTYYKFVSDGSSESFEEIRATIEIYRRWFSTHHGIVFNPHSIYVMPVGASVEQQEHSQKLVASQCLKYGYNFCARVHCWVWGNAVGT